MSLWATEAEIDEDLQDVDLNLAIGNYGQNLYNAGTT
jgi:translation initiation factor 3 subunit L